MIRGRKPTIEPNKI